MKDTAAVLDLVRESLEGAGFEVEIATTATEATERLAGRRYAAILSDCLLPDLPPLEWLAVARDAAPTTLLVVYSGAVHLDELQGLARDGAWRPCWRSPSRRPSSWRRCGRRSRSRPD